MMAPTSDPGDDAGGKPQASQGLRGIYGFAPVSGISPPDTEVPPHRVTATWVNQVASLNGTPVTMRITDDWAGSLIEAQQRLRDAAHEAAFASIQGTLQPPADLGIDFDFVPEPLPRRVPQPLPPRVDVQVKWLTPRPPELILATPKRPEVKLVTPKRRHRGRGFHRREALPLRIYAAVGSFLQVGLRSGLSSRSLTGAAVLIAGKKRGAVAGEWRSHLSGWTGHGLAREDQLRAAWGFLWSAVRYRLRDAADLAWRPADAVLRSRTLSNLVVVIPVLVVVLAVLRHDGQYGLVTNDQNIIGLGCGIYGVIRTGRWWRRVKPPKHKPGQVKE